LTLTLHAQIFESAITSLQTGMRVLIY